MIPFSAAGSNVKLMLILETPPKSYPSKLYSNAQLLHVNFGEISEKTANARERKVKTKGEFARNRIERNAPSPIGHHRHRRRHERHR